MHPALQRLIRVLAECEAERLCADQEKGPGAVDAEALTKVCMNKPTSTFREESVGEQSG